MPCSARIKQEEEELPVTMTRLAAGAALNHARKQAGCTWQQLAAAIDRSVVWTTSALLGQQPLERRQIQTVAELLKLDDEVVEALALPPVRGNEACDPTDPVIYRLTEVVQVYGAALKELIGEEFGDGIMSAIDFRLEFERLEDPKGDRVRLVLDGKFLPYRVW
jgi:cyanate lyase